MQDIIVEKPYEFVPPNRSEFWQWFAQFSHAYDRFLRSKEGVVRHEIRGGEKLEESIKNGDGILLTPNHCRYADPLVMGWLARKVNCYIYGMASWHLFNMDWFSSWALPRIGAFSINREGVDRQAIDASIEILFEGKRPLVIFPEGAVSRTNDRLHAMYDGVSFIARAAAKRRKKKGTGGRVVIHPVAIKYLFEGDFPKAADNVLTEIESRFTWKPQRDLHLIPRIIKLGDAILGLKEMEYFGGTQRGDLRARMDGLIDRLLTPLEDEWLNGTKEQSVVPRVKSLRMQMIPDMVNGRVSDEERKRRWSQLADIYLAQQISCYIPDYIVSRPSVMRLLETVERYEEDLTDKVRLHGKFKVIIDVGDEIEVGPDRDRRATTDPVMDALETNLQAQLDILAMESPLLHEAYPEVGEYVP